MSEGSTPNKMVTFLSQVPAWLWVTAGTSFVAFTVFLVFLSQQTPDQYAMTQYPPWQHAMSHNELLAYHRALKSGAYQGDELDAKRFLYRQGSSTQLYAQQSNSNTFASGTLDRGSPGRSLTMEQVTGFASRSQPINQHSLQQAQQYIALERNRNGMINTSQVATNIPRGIYVQTASLQSINDAAKLRQSLTDRGFSPFIQEAYVQNRKWYRVRLGPYPTMADAREAALNLQRNQYQAQVIQSK